MDFLPGSPTLPWAYDPIAGFALRLTDPADYYDMFQFCYQSMFPVCLGHSPQELSTRYGIPILLNPDYAASIAYPNIPVFDSQRRFPDGSLIPLDVGSGTHAGQQWQWQCSVELYQGGQPIPAAQPFQQALVYWAGNSNLDNGTQFVPTPFPCNSGTVCITAFADALYNAFMRHSQMPCTAHAGSSTVRTPGAIASFGPTGFTASNDVDNGLNRLGHTYVAIVWRDANPSPTPYHMAVGDYVGGGSHTAQIEVSTGSRYIGYNTLSSGDLFATIAFTGGLFIDQWDSPYFARMNGPWLASPGFQIVTVTPPVVYHQTGLGELTHLWIWVGSVGYAMRYPSATPTQATAVLLQATAAGNVVGSTVATVNADGTFNVGSSPHTNLAGRQYFWVGLNVNSGIDASNIFRSFLLTGTSTNPDRKTGLNIRTPAADGPAWALAERYLTSGVVAQQGAWWRSTKPIIGHTTTRSTILGSGFQDFQGVVDMGVASGGYVDVGSTVATPGDLVYGYAFPDDAGAGVITHPPREDGPLTITCPNGSGMVGYAYGSAFTASSGTAPYDFVIVSGPLPPGLMLNAGTGALTGTPLTAGTYTFQVLVNDATFDPDVMTQHTCTITIAVPTEIPVCGIGDYIDTVTPGGSCPVGLLP